MKTKKITLSQLKRAANDPDYVRRSPAGNRKPCVSEKTAARNASLHVEPPDKKMFNI